MKTYCVRYKDPEDEIDEIEVEVEDHEGEAEAEEAAREELTAEHPSVDTDEWDVLSVEEVVPMVGEVVLYKYDIDIPAECWAADIGRETLYLIAQRGSDGKVAVEVSHGYEPGSPQHRREAALFAENEAAIRAGAEKAVAELEASLSEAAAPRRP
jgi:hypothetical protein